MYGYTGKILFVDLSTGQSRVERFDEAFARQYLGGNGFAAKILCEHLAPGIDPFSPQNILVLAVGPVTDTLIQSNCRAYIATKSPLTGLYFDSTFGGRFAAMQKRTGFEAIVVTGKAPYPSYLLVTEEGAEIKPAGSAWGQLTLEAIDTLRSREGIKDLDVLAIGPAGEHLVRFACAVHAFQSRDAIAGRGGIGAVMGSKNLKAIAVRGNIKTEVASLAAVKTVVRENSEQVKVGTRGLAEFGTPVLVQPINTMGLLGTRNVQQEVFAQAHAISGERLKDLFWERDTTCFRCSIACGKDFRVDEGEFAGIRAKMPEYETLFAFGSMADVDEPAAIIKANKLCDELGLDTISMGVTLTFVMECVEKGLISTREIGKVLTFGNYHAMLDLIEATARREGFGNLLAEGSARLADHIGKGASRFLYTVKRLELPAHSARGLKGMSIGYATATRGGSHHDTRPTLQYDPNFDRKSIEGKPAFAIQTQNFTAVDDSLTQCRFTSERGFGGVLNEKYAQMINTVTGWNLSVEDIEEIGERIVTMERVFNVREGVRRGDDVLPYRVMHEPIPEGPSRGMYCPPEELEAMLDEYYQLRGWDRQGIPTPERLKALGLEFLIPNLPQP